ncbi:mannose-6-phosphate isomerase, class I [Nesterenkonia lutea]|uniref:mannose-6-phosphate isomerase n=1 Tax=Nesterenkonia lutea TaxID=272919 RepID=A0ABR9JBQ1_9MICC|nr:mannose-6-phosphate isomerase, class I [Nesterenkonia lutea]MBE1523338.1 mannose-6-phosphate isomerase [Nesterenkonia lutea]
MFRMINPVREYAWGSTTAFSELFGWAASATPQAEIWMGAHPADPSSLELVPEGQGSGAAVAPGAGPTEAQAGVHADGEGVVDLPQYLQRSGEPAGNFPFLLKVLAAEQPLSIQSHPTTERARRGFAAEEASGLELNHPRRSYKDPNAKPELIVALSEFSALCGFRPHVQAAAELRALTEMLTGADRTRGVLDQLQEHVAGQDYASALEYLLRSGREESTAAAEELTGLLTAADSDADLTARIGSGAAQMLLHIARSFPQDPGIFVALLLNRIQLQPGESIYLPAGNLHAYLHGVGVEIMANSDNVLRGGLTSKHLDVDELLSVTDCNVLPVPHCPVHETACRETGTGSPTPSPRRVRYQAPFEEFELERIEFPGEAVLESPGHGIVLCTAGELTLSAPADPAADPTAADPASGEAADPGPPRMLSLTAGTSAFLPETAGHRIRAAAHAQAFVATTVVAPVTAERTVDTVSPDQEQPRP